MVRGTKKQCIKSIITSILVCSIIAVAFFFLLGLSTEATPKVPQSPAQKPISLPQEVTSQIADIASAMKSISSQLQERSKYSPWWVIFGSWFTGIVALFVAFLLNFVTPWWRKPSLKVEFEEDKLEYASDLFFEKLPPPFIDPLINGDEPFWLRQPGFNSRVKIINSGRSVAKNVQARLESIKCDDKFKKLPSEIFYHPTVVKWSGEKEYNKVDIAPFKSHFFLDLIYCINETYSEIIKYYDEKNISIPKWMMLPNDYSGDVYWAVWVDRSYLRGIPEKYTEEGHFELNYIVMADNCKSIKFTATLDWEKKAWNKPIISIK